MDGRGRTRLDDLLEGLALGVVEAGGLAGCLGIGQSVWTVSVEAHHPIAHGLQPDPANPGGIGA